MISNGGKEIFFLCFLHYNDTCKVNQQFTGGKRMVVKLNIQTAELALREASESNPGASVTWSTVPSARVSVPLSAG